jgi:hypothetical protein
VEGSRPQVETEHYRRRSYDTRERFFTYWAQIEEVLRLQSFPVLEVGVGNGFVSDYLRRRAVPVTTCDFDVRLRPEVVCDIRALGLRSGSVGTVLASEILEHIPFDTFVPALRELHYVSKRFAVISVPNASRAYRIWIHTPWGPKRWLFSLRWLPRRRTPLTPRQLFWEIDLRDYPIEKVKGCLAEAGWIVDRDYRLFESPYHHFFVLRKA